MFYKLLRLFPVLLLLLLGTQAQAAAGKTNSKQAAANKQIQDGVDHNATAIELSAEINFNPAPVLKLQLSQPGDLFSADNALTAIYSNSLLTGAPCNLDIAPVYLQLLFPFHVFW